MVVVVTVVVVVVVVVDVVGVVVRFSAVVYVFVFVFFCFYNEITLSLLNEPNWSASIKRDSTINRSIMRILDVFQTFISIDGTGPLETGQVDQEEMD